LARRLQQACTLLWNSLVSDETTSPQFAVLNAVASSDDVDQRTVGELTGLDRSTTAEIVSRLADRGLLRRVRDPWDGRRNVLRLTTDGEALHRQTARRVARMNKVLLAPLDPAEQETFMELMRKVLAAADDFRPSGKTTPLSRTTRGIPVRYGFRPGERAPVSPSPRASRAADKMAVFAIGRAAGGTGGRSPGR
jgi:MarR family transcriptional regulator, temperature-dependent positive regulator of motility